MDRQPERLELFFTLAVCLFAILVVVQIVTSLFVTDEPIRVQSDGTASSSAGVSGLIGTGVKFSFILVIGIVLIYLLAGILMGPKAGIFGGMAQQLLPVWIAMIVIFAASFKFKRKLGLYGKLFDSTVGMIGFGIVLFWVLAVLWAVCLTCWSRTTACLRCRE